MPDMKRVDMSNDLDSLLRDVKAATEEVKQRQDDDRHKEARAAEKERSRKLSAIIVAVAAIALFVLAYFVVFAGSNYDAGQMGGTITQHPTPHVSVGASTTRSNTSNSVSNIPPIRPQPQNVPPDNYEQPRGM